ncbi:MAG: radical SAM protein [Thaumarchaeota archaeon]|jgi:uncharacterized protein|nr:radical SAM protein [Candidatus Geocrenenecus arthurdayi]
MEISKYAFVLDNENGYITLFSGLYGSVVRIKNDLLNDIIKNLKDFRETSASAYEAIKTLLEAKILVESEEEEQKFFERAINALKNRREIDLLVNTTRRCNMNCIYCYEQKEHKDLDERTIKRIPTFIKWLSERKEANKLLVGFFGGEPLLRTDLIDRVLNEIGGLEEEMRIRVGLITNGTLLSRRVVQLLARYDIAMIQVTLDGPREVHNSRRPLISGRGSYDLILKNLTNTVDAIPLLQIRINVDRENLNNCMGLLDDLEDLGLKRPNVRLYFARVYAATSTNAKYRSKCLWEDYSQLTELALQAKRRGFEVFFNPYPKPRYLYCAAFTGTHFVVDSNGDLYPCLGGIGHQEYKVGNILLEEFFDSYNIYNWMNRSPLVLDPCSTCIYAPLCGGGCGSESLGYNGDLRIPVCPPNKFIWDARFIPLRELLKL